PPGSLVYQSGTPATGTIAFAGDTDDFILDLDPGQTLAILARPSGSAQLTIELRDPSNTLIGSATAPAGGAEALLQAVAAAAAGPYRVTTGSAGGLGLYSVAVMLNAALEAEEHGGGSNDTIGTAQDLSGSFIPLGGGADRGAVLGQVQPTVFIYTATAVPFSFA